MQDTSQASPDPGNQVLVVYDPTGQYVVDVVDSETGEVLTTSREEQEAILDYVKRL